MMPPSYCQWQTVSRRVCLLLGALYAAYAIYYALRLKDPNSWNEHQTKLNSTKWHSESGYKNLMKYLGSESLSDDVTIVTAYFNLGTFVKDGIGARGPSHYERWMSVFGRIKNPLIVFTDQDHNVNLFKNFRRNFPDNHTKYFKMDRSDLWAFSLAPDINKIFAHENYPKFYPNTINENYSCVMHAKFELMHKVINETLFSTKYISWLDIGLFRAVVHETDLFSITIPPGWDQEKVAYSEVHEFDPSLRPFDVISNNYDWVGGAMFLGRPDILYSFTKDYMATALKLIDKAMMSTDQQLIYIMYLPKFDFDNSVDIQTYTTHSHDDWFYLGYLIKDLWDRQHKRTAVPLIKFFLSTI